MQQYLQKCDRELLKSYKIADVCSTSAKNCINNCWENMPPTHTEADCACTCYRLNDTIDDSAIGYNTPWLHSYSKHPLMKNNFAIKGKIHKIVQN